MKVGNYNALMADCPAYQKCESFAVIFNILYLSAFVGFASGPNQRLQPSR